LNTWVAEGGKSNATMKRKLEDAITAVKQKNRIRKINQGRGHFCPFSTFPNSMEDQII